MSLGNTALQLFCCYYSWCLYREFQCWIYCIFTLVLSEVCAVHNMAVFSSSLTSCFPDMLLTYFLNDFEIAPVAPIITGITFVYYYYYYYLLQLISHSVAVVLPLVTNKNKYT